MLIAVSALFFAPAAGAASSKPVTLKAGAYTTVKLTTSTIQPVTAKRVKVTLNAPHGVKSLRVTVGGKVVSARFKRASKTRFTASLRVGTELTAGVNHLVAVTRNADGKAVGSLRLVVGKRGPAAGSISVKTRNGAHLVTVKTSGKPVLFSVRLNGGIITRHFNSKLKGTQTEPISPDDGLHFGRNTLEFRAALKNGQYVRKTVVYKVSRTRPLAAAGDDRVARAGNRVYLSSLRSRPRGSETKYAWKIMQKPKGSKVQLKNPRTRNPSIKSDLNGTYKLELTTTRGSKSGTDVATVNVLPQYPPIGARLDTAAPQSGGGYALEIGGNCTGSGQQHCRKISVPYAAGKPVVFVVLDRSTLEVKSTINLPGNVGDAVYIQTQLAALGGSNAPADMAILAALPGQPVSQPEFMVDVKVLTGLTPKIGANGGWSAIGVPSALGALDGAVSGAVNAGETQIGTAVVGSQQGYLQYDASDERFGYASGKSTSYNTSTAASTATTNTMRVAGDTYASSALAAGCTGGFQLVILRAATLTPASAFQANQTFSTNCADSNDTQTGVTNLNGQIGTAAGNVNSGSDGPLVVFLQTIGTPIPANPSQTVLNLLSGAAQAVEQLGGTDETFNDAIGTAGASYALAGSSSLFNDSPSNPAGQPFAPEATTLQSGSGGSLDGVLQFDRHSRYLPVSGTTNVDQTGFWSDLAFQAPQAWPTGSAQGEKNALAYISDKYDIEYSPSSSCYEPSTPDVRFEYCDLNANWGELLAGLKPAKTTPPKGCGCTLTQWNAIAADIPQEIRWVQRIYKYVGIVQKIYGTATVQPAFSVGTIASEVENAINPPKNRSIWGGWLDFTGDLTNALAMIPGEDAVKNTIAAVSGLAFVFGDGLTQPDGSATLGPIVQTEANQLPGELAARYLSSSEQFGHLGDIVVSDYGKLKAAGTSTQIQIDENTISGSINNLMVGGYRFAYKRLLATVYDSYGLPQSGLSPNAVTPQEYICYTSPGYYDKVKPFGKSGPGTWITQNGNNPALPVFGGNEPVMLALGEKGNETAIEVDVAPSKLVNPLTQPISFNGQGVPVTFGEYAPAMFRHNFAQRMFSCTN